MATATVTPVVTKIRQGLELWRTSDLTIEFRVAGPERFVLHFKDPSVLGVEFAVLKTGVNPFTLRNTKETCCYVWSEAELAPGLVKWEPVSASGATEAAGPVRPMVPPIIIPPGM